VGHAEHLEVTEEPLPVGAVGVVEDVEDRGGALGGLAIARVFGVEDAQGVLLEAALGVVAELALERGEVREQGLAVAVAGGAEPSELTWTTSSPTESSVKRPQQRSMISASASGPASP